MMVIDPSKMFSIYSSLNKWERMMIDNLHRKYPMDIEKIAEIYVTLDKNETATRIRVRRECFYDYNKYK